MHAGMSQAARIHFAISTRACDIGEIDYRLAAREEQILSAPVVTMETRVSAFKKGWSIRLPIANVAIF